MFKKLFFTFCGLCLTGVVFAQNNVCDTRYCLGVVDAGSTGTRIFLYSYDKDATGNPVQIHEEWSKKVTPGLASLELRQEKIEAYLDGLFSSSLDSKIPLYFYATAGMRLLPKKTQENYYDVVRQWFDTHQSSWVLREAKTITGKEEGIWGWISTAYQLNALESGEAHQIGVMDTGGASVQIVFPIHEPITSSSAQVTQVSLYGQNYTLYAYSALGLGQTLVSQQFLNHPACYPSGYILTDGTEAFGDALSCVHEVTHLVNDVHHVNDDVGVWVNQEPRAWYVMGGVVYTARHPLLDLNVSFTLNELLQSADEKACSRSWSEVSSFAFDNADSACFLGAYYYALMTRGYGLSPDEEVHSISDGSWTLGVLFLNQQQLH